MVQLCFSLQNQICSFSVREAMEALFMLWLFTPAILFLVRAFHVSVVTILLIPFSLCLYTFLGGIYYTEPCFKALY